MKSKRILIVDNDDHFLEAADIILREEGFQTVLAKNGNEALDLLEKDRASRGLIGLIITDIRMPEMNGFELVAQLKTRGIRLPIIAATGFGDADTLARLIHCGITEYIAKPCTIRELTGAVERAYEKWSLVNNNEMFASIRKRPTVRMQSLKQTK